jgi:hypothetical protein
MQWAFCSQWVKSCLGSIQLPSYAVSFLLSVSITKSCLGSIQLPSYAVSFLLSVSITKSCLGSIQLPSYAVSFLQIWESFLPCSTTRNHKVKHGRNEYRHYNQSWEISTQFTSVQLKTNHRFFLFIVYSTTLFQWLRLYSVEWRGDTWMTNWKWCGRKR